MAAARAVAGKFATVVVVEAGIAVADEPILPAAGLVLAAELGPAAAALVALVLAPEPEPVAAAKPTPPAASGIRPGANWIAAKGVIRECSPAKLPAELVARKD